MALNPRILEGIDNDVNAALEGPWDDLLTAYAARRAAEQQPTFIRQVQAVISRFGALTAGLAGRAYRADRVAARVTGRFTVPLAPALDLEQSEESLRWATRKLLYADDADTVSALTVVQGVTQRLVTEPARETVYRAVAEDRLATGWARTTRTNCCYFCALLASRGAVYKDSGAAGRDANKKFIGDGDAKFHDHCHCTIEPLFRGNTFELAPHVAAADRLYDESTRNVSGVEKLRAFRRAYNATGRGVNDEPQEG